MAARIVCDTKHSNSNNGRTFIDTIFFETNIEKINYANQDQVINFYLDHLLNMVSRMLH